MTDTTTGTHGIVLSEMTYNLLKDLNQIALPGLGTATATGLALYGVDAHVSSVVVGTILLVATILGIFLKIVSVQFNANAKVVAVATAARVAAIADPVITTNATDPSKLDIQPAGGFLADAESIQVSGGSQ